MSLGIVVRSSLVTTRNMVARDANGHMVDLSHDTKEAAATIIYNERERERAYKIHVLDHVFESSEGCASSYHTRCSIRPSCQPEAHDPLPMFLPRGVPLTPRDE